MEGQIDAHSEGSQSAEISHLSSTPEPIPNQSDRSGSFDQKTIDRSTVIQFSGDTADKPSMSKSQRSGDGVQAQA